LLPPALAAAGLAGLVVAVLILRRPVWGAYGLVLSVPVQKAVSFDVGPVEVTVTQILFVLVLGVWWAWLSMREDRRLVLTPIAVALILFLVATLPSLWVTHSMPESLAEISRWSVTILAYVIMTNSVRNRREMNGLIAVMLVAGTSEALLGLVQAYTGVGPESFNVEGVLTRAYGTIGAPNSFAGYLNMSLPLAIALAVYHWGRWGAARRAGAEAGVGVPALIGLVALVLFWALLTTLSRGAWIGLAAGLLVMALALARSRRAAWAIWPIVGTGLVFGLLSVMGALPGVVAERVGQLVGQIAVFDPRGVTPTPENYALVERMVHWQVAGNMFLSSPWVGVGIGNYNVLFNEFGVQGWPWPRGHAHNYYLHLLGEVGLVGLTFYVAMLVTAVVVGVRALRAVRLRGDIYGEAVVTGALGVLVTFMTHNFFENLHALNMGIHWGAALALFTLVGKGFEGRDPVRPAQLHKGWGLGRSGTAHPARHVL
jgi:O-antigen ligase